MSRFSPGADVLDICSSWISHLPEDKKYGRVEGVGMNIFELENIKILTGKGCRGASCRDSYIWRVLKLYAQCLPGFVAQDLNKDPSLPYEDGAFDAVNCVVSVDYLTQPLQVPAGWCAREVFCFAFYFLPVKIMCQVFKEVYRVLKPGGTCHISFSNRCFPSKAIEAWLRVRETRHFDVPEIRVSSQCY